MVACRRYIRSAMNFVTSVASTTYYLDFQPDGNYSWGTAHSTQENYLPIAEATTDSAGNIITVTDKRPLSPGVGKINADLLRSRNLTAEHDAHLVNYNAHLVNYVLQVPYGVTSGPSNYYLVNLSPAPTGYVEGLAVAVKIHVDNAGASTLNINGMGGKSIKKPNGNDVSGGNLKAGSIYTLRYNGINFILQGEMGVGNAQPEHVLTTKTFTNDNGEQTGTMPNRGAYNITPGVSNIAIPNGYHNGAGVVYGDGDLMAGNIKQGVNIFGVAGNLIPGNLQTSNSYSSQHSNTAPDVMKSTGQIATGLTIDANVEVTTNNSLLIGGCCVPIPTSTGGTQQLFIDEVEVASQSIPANINTQYHLRGSRVVNSGNRIVRQYLKRTGTDLYANPAVTFAFVIGGV